MSITLTDFLEQIDLSGTKITDQELTGLCNLPLLQRLVLNNTGITDAGLTRLHLPALQELSLKKTKIIGTGLVNLNLPVLRHLTLSNPKTRSDLPNPELVLALNLPSLEELYLGNWEDTFNQPKLVLAVLHLPALQYLHLEGLKSVVRGWAHLTSLPSRSFTSTITLRYTTADWRTSRIVILTSLSMRNSVNGEIRTPS